MTKEALQVLISWAREQTKEIQAEFAEHLETKIKWYQEHQGAGGITGRVMEKLIENWINKPE